MSKAGQYSLLQISRQYLPCTCPLFPYQVFLFQYQALTHLSSEGFINKAPVMGQLSRDQPTGAAKGDDGAKHLSKLWPCRSPGLSRVGSGFSFGVR